MIQVSPTLWRGFRPTTQADFDALYGAGFRRILNLERGWFEFFHGVTNRETLMTIRSLMIPIRIEMGDFFPPSKEELDAALCVIGPSKTLVHCLSQKDRTGMLCAYYRVKIEGWPIEKAIEEMHAMGMHWWYKDAWTKALREYCK